MNIKRVFFIFILLMLLQIGVRAQVGVNFTGGQNFLTVTPFYAIPAEFTIEAWIKTSQTTTGTLVTWNSPGGQAFLFRIRDKKLELGEWISGWKELRSTSDINTGNWRHVAVTRTGTTAKLYVDGVLEATKNDFVNVSSYSISRLNIGALPSNTSESYVGSMDEVRIWNKVLTDTEIQNNLYSQLQSGTSNLVLNFQFDNSLSSNSVNTYTATITGAVPFVTTDYLSNVQRALFFSGNQNFLTVSPYVPMSNSFTIEAWIKTTQASTGTLLTWNTLNQNAFLFRIRNKKLELGEWINGWRELRSISDVNTGKWTHVAVTREGTTARLFVNGKLEATKTDMVNPTIYSVNQLTLGGFQTNFSESFVGSMDEVRVWNKVLTEQEIANNLFTNYPSSQNNLVCNFKFENSYNSNSIATINAVPTGSVPYVWADYLKENEPAEIRTLSIKESSNNPLKLTVNLSKNAKGFWKIIESNQPAPLLGEILNSTANSGNFVYRTPDANQIEYINTNLVVGKTYKLYFVSNYQSKISSVFSSVSETSEFTYQGSFASLPLGWTTSDIGNLGIEGEVNYDKTNGVYTLKGSGLGFANTSDNYRSLDTTILNNGAVDIKVKVTSLQNTNSSSRAGLMIRFGNEANDKMYMLSISPSALQRIERSAKGRSLHADERFIYPDSLKIPIWLRLVYKNRYVAYKYSLNGNDWRTLGHSSLNWENSPIVDYKVGMFVSSNDNSMLSEAGFDSLSVSTSVDYNPNDRGLNFDQTNLPPITIPKYSTDSVRLPRPILDGNKEWLKMYWFAWKIALGRLGKPSDYSDNRVFIGPFYDEAFSSAIFQWDIIFMTMFGKYANHIFPATTSFDNFYARQYPTGMIPREIRPTGDDSGTRSGISPPLFAWSEYENFKYTRDTTRLRLVMPVLEKYIEGVEYHHNSFDTPHKLYWTNGYASGLDDTPADTGRPGGHNATDHQGWTCLSSQLVLSCNSMANIFDILSMPDKASKYRAKSAEIATKINQWLWNEENGLYYEVDTKGVQTKHNTITGFWPMLADITDKAKDEKLVANLKNPNRFWRDMIFPATAADHPKYKGFEQRGAYWEGGVWAPTNYMTIKGLSARGYTDFARESAEKYIAGLYEVFERTGTLWENYGPDRVNGILREGTSDQDGDTQSRRDFVGWTGLGPISLLIEEVIGINPEPLTNTITWRINRMDRHGIENLVVGDKVTTLICNKRSIADTTAVLTVTTNKPYTLVVRYREQNFIFNLQQGVNQLKCELLTTVAETVADSKLSIFPNPAGNSVIVKYSGFDQKASLKIIDAGGRTLKNYKMTNIEQNINISDLMVGLYMVKVVGKNSEYSTKLLVARD